MRRTKFCNIERSNIAINIVSELFYFLLQSRFYFTKSYQPTSLNPEFMKNIESKCYWFPVFVSNSSLIIYEAISNRNIIYHRHIHFHRVMWSFKEYQIIDIK